MADDPARARAPRDGSWLTDLFRYEGPQIARYVRRHVHDTDAAADLVQEAFVRLASAGKLAELRRPEAYLQRIVRNLVIDRFRRRVSDGFCHVPLDERDLPFVEPDQEYAIEAEDLMRRYRQAVDALTPRTRQVFLLHRVEEITYAEIARRLGITVATVEYHMTRALVHLDETLGE